MDDVNEWEVKVMDGAASIFDTVLVMAKPDNKELKITSESSEHRCFTALSGLSSLGYTVVGHGIVLSNDRSDDTKHKSLVVWKSNAK